MPADDILLDCEEHMEKAIDHLKHELRGVRTGRASPAMVENVRVDYYGAQTEIRSIAAITVPEAHQIVIKPFNPQDLKAIERGINDAKLPLTPHSDGRQLRLVLPPMSQEVRQKMAGACKTMAETAKVAIRNARRDANKLVDTEEKGGIIPEDESRRTKDEIQELTKRYEAKAEELIAQKTKEILEV
jgi:ribosome recycling factor